MEVGSRGPFRDPEHAPDLRVLESFDVMQDDHGTLPFAQCGQGLTQPATQFIRLAGIAERRCDRIGQGVGIAHFLSARDVERGVGHDAMQPRPERLIWQEAVERSVGMEESLLNRVLGILVREDNGARHRIGSPLMQANQFRKRLRFAALRGDNQRMLALARRVTRHGAGTSRCRYGGRAGREGDGGHGWVA